MSATTTATRADDWQLLERYEHGRCEESFARLVARYADLVFHTALRRCHDRQLAEDVTQAVFIVLARSAATLKPTGSLAAWLHKTAAFATTHAVRAEARRRRRERAAAREESVTPADGTPDDLLHVEDELHRLHATDRHVLAIHYLEGRTMQQTAEQLGVSVEAARKRLSRALDRLRQRLADRGVTVESQQLASSIGGIAASTNASMPSASLASAAIAGGKGGAAFALAGDVIHITRLVALQQAAAVVIVGVAIFTGLVGVVIASQRPGPPSMVTAPAVPATQPAAASQPPANAAAPRRSVQLPEAIRKALSRNAEQVGPTITLSWRSQVRSPMPVPQLAKTLKIDEVWADERANGRMTFRCTWQDGKYLTSYRQLPWPTKAQPGCHYVQTSFDGEDLYMCDYDTDADGVPLRLEPGTMHCGLIVVRLLMSRPKPRALSPTSGTSKALGSDCLRG